MLYEYACSENHRSVRWIELAKAPKLGAKTRCDACGKKAKRILSTPNLNGTTKFGGNFDAQSKALLHPNDVLERPFRSVSEIDAFCKKNNLEHAGNTMPAHWKTVREKRAKGLVD